MSSLLKPTARYLQINTQHYFNSIKYFNNEILFTNFLVPVLVIDPGDDPGGLDDGRVSRHPSVGVGGDRVPATGARDHDQLICGGQVEDTLSI